MKYTLKISTVDAYRVTQASVRLIADKIGARFQWIKDALASVILPGQTPAAIAYGDWIVLTPSGTYGVVPAGVFQYEYTPVAEWE